MSSTQPTPTQENRPLQIFLCHSSADKNTVRDLHYRLEAEGFAPWLDEKEILPGQNWREEIPKAVHASDVVIVCLSKDFHRAGYRQKEVRLALEVVDEQPEGTIFLIPLKLEECEVPTALSRWQWAKLYEIGGYDHLLRALKIRARAIGVSIKPVSSTAEASDISQESKPSGTEVGIGDSTVRLDKKMIYVPPGKFLAGPRSETRSVGGYWIDETPVTNEEFAQFLEVSGYLQNNPYKVAQISNFLTKMTRAAKEKPDHPVTMITWFDAQAYAVWAGKRLPTSDEWERAARGADGALFPWGNEFNPSFCNCRDSNIGDTTPVFKYGRGRSPYGCFDMAGNVFEWVEDWAQEPRFSNVLFSEKINRGGSFNRPHHNLLCHYLESDPPDTRMIDVGFRCASSGRG